MTQKINKMSKRLLDSQIVEKKKKKKPYNQFFFLEEPYNQNLKAHKSKIVWDLHCANFAL